MRGIFGLAYLFLFFSTLVASLFVIFHIYRYALDRRLAAFMILLFLVTITVLLVSNTILFFNLPLESLGANQIHSVFSSGL